MTDIETTKEVDLWCIGTPDRHPETRIEPYRTADGEWHWTCPRCGWLLPEFLGEPVTDYIDEDEYDA